MILLYLLVTTHISIAFFSIYAHRGLAHKSLNFHPVLFHVMRFWLWMMDGTIMKEWVSIHRSHHVAADRPSDPHSPFVIGTPIEKVKRTLSIVLKSIVFGYKDFATVRELEYYGKDVPNDTIERKLYTPYHQLGVFIMLLLNIWLFGWVGIFVWIIQISWVKFWTIAIITAAAHHFGYRDKKCKDNSRNLFPVGIIIAGEELHNNHHMNPYSPDFSRRWFEFDIGWIYIKFFKFLGLATIRNNINSNSNTNNNE